jgi:hypothetical protein
MRADDDRDPDRHPPVTRPPRGATSATAEMDDDDGPAPPRAWAAIAVAAAVAIAVSVLALAVIVITDERPAPPAPARRHIDVVGDSLVHQASAVLRSKLDEAGYDATVVGLPAQSLGSGPIRARLDEVARTAGDVLVVATTTNDAQTMVVVDGQPSSAPAYREEITDLLYRFADRCVVVVNARDRINPVYLPERAAVLNAELAQMERLHDNLVLVDWAMLSRELPIEWFSPDLLHFGGRVEDEVPDSPSARVYAGAIVGGVRRCLEHAVPSTRR